MKHSDIILGGAMGSDLLDFAATFHTVFEEDSVHGIMEHLRDIVGKKEDGGIDPEVIKVASYFLQEMERRSPLSLCAMHKLLELGNHSETSISNCMGREMVVQKNLFQKQDFQNWFDLHNNTEGVDPHAVPKWKHASVSDVTDDEVDELFHEN